MLAVGKPGRNLLALEAIFKPMRVLIFSEPGFKSGSEIWWVFQVTLPYSSV